MMPNAEILRGLLNHIVTAAKLGNDLSKLCKMTVGNIYKTRSKPPWSRKLTHITLGF
jgi:hypothetical protein